MSDAEWQILNYMRGDRERSFSRKEIARKAARREVFTENQHWADAPLAALVATGVIERDLDGMYRLLVEEG
ncbi:MAG: hypothetical protein WCR20_05095 [Verrucomicrobiota bacterium]|jgi:hypothetical protein|nr:hypothetical protein [Verrucomicrobiota bacterium]